MVKINNYVNYGDVSQFDGGLWIKQDDDIENYYHFVTCNISDGQYLITDGMADLKDAWINWKGVFNCCDIDENSSDIKKVASLIFYYACENFGGTLQIFDTRGQARKEINSYGIIIKRV